ncbi:MAG: hypothetical protein BroJett033_7900 [Chloroflexota bacterium]|nr:MAG: hypothetical protein BroJett033_7900 [Chloroflexota bacterium]
MSALAWLIALVVAAAQHGAPVTVGDCLLRSGYSATVPATPVTALVGVDAWWDAGERVLRDGALVGLVTVADGDGTRRMLSFHAYAGGVYVFVYKHPDDPGRRLPGEDASVWHGDCLLRVVGHG